MVIESVKVFTKFQDNTRTDGAIVNILIIPLPNLLITVNECYITIINATSELVLTIIEQTLDTRLVRRSTSGSSSVIHLHNGCPSW